MHRILVCDDEKDIVSALRIYLEAEGYQVMEAYNGREALELLKKEELHLVLMDVMMPELDGVSALAAIRQRSNVPVIMLTAKSEDSDKVLGLTLGADDYVTKPFNPVELLARVRSQLRRYMQLGGNSPARGDVLKVGELVVDAQRGEASVNGELLNLTSTEFDILKYFVENPGKVLSPREIYTAVWKNEPYGAENTVAVHVRHIREKIEINPAEPRYIKAVWGKGYRLEGGG